MARSTLGGRRVQSDACLFFAVLGMAVSPGLADSFTWQQGCASNNWYTTCTDDPHVQCSTDPVKYYFHNNWGREACGNDPGPAFPGASDGVAIGSGDVLLSGAASIHDLFLDGGRTLEVNGDPADLSAAAGITNAGTMIIANGGTVFVGNSTIDNSGSMILRYGGMWGKGFLSCTGNETIAGAGEFVFECGDINGAGTLTNAADHTIRGAGGIIHAALVNEGSVYADWTNHALELRTAPKTNNGQMGVTNGSYLDVYSSINQGGTGVLYSSGAASLVRLHDGIAVTGGTLETSGGGLIIGSDCSATTTFTDLTNSGEVNFSNAATLAVTGTTLTNNGIIGINYHGMCGGGHLRFDANVTLNGSGEVHLETGDIDTAGGVTFTHAAAHTIHGRDHIHAAMTNQGTINADWAGNTLTLDDKPKSNSGTISATNGGYLDLSAAVTQTAGGLILSDGGTVRLRGGSVTGGTLNSTGSSKIETYSNTVSTVADVTNQGHLHVLNNGSTLAVSGSALTNHGTIELTQNTGMGHGKMRLDANITLGGPGELLCGADIYSDTGNTLTNAAGHTIRSARGSIRAALVNDGTVNADLSGQHLSLRDAAKTNNALMKATGGSFFDIYTTVNQGPDGLILSDGGTVQLCGGTIVGGMLDSTSGSEIVTLGGATSSVSGVTNNGYLRVPNSNSILAVTGATLTNNGTIQLTLNTGMGHGRMRLDADATLDGTGDLLCRADIFSDTGKSLTNASGHTIHGHQGVIGVAMLNNGVIRADVNGGTLRINPQGAGSVNAGTMIADPDCELEINSATLFSQTGGQTIVNGTLDVNGGPFALQGGSLSGIGNVAGDVANTGGSVEPGNSAGTLRINGNYTQGAGGKLSIQLGGAAQGTEYDLLNVTGTALLDGELHVEPINGYAPQVGQQFVILTAPTVTGCFTTVTGPGQYQLTCNANNVTITVLVVPFDDCNNNGMPDAQDIAGGTSQDCNGNNVPDECEISVNSTAPGGPFFCTQGCDADCNNNGIPDACDADADADGVPDDCDNCPQTANADQSDTDGDGRGNACDGCPADAIKFEPGPCGCGVAEVDTDGDGTPNCNDGCPDDPFKTDPGACGCGQLETDGDGDGVPDCVDNCPQTSNPGQEDSDGDGVGDACTEGPGPEPTPDCGTGVCAQGTLPALPMLVLGVGVLRKRTRTARRVRGR